MDHKMGKSNEDVVRALVCDLEETDKIIKDILSYTGEIRTFSWKYPNCSGDAIEIIPLLKELSGSIEERYIFIMELLTDRLNFFLHSLMVFLETFPGSYKKYDPSPYVSLPPFMSFGALIHSIWNLLKSVYNAHVDKMEESIKIYLPRINDTAHGSTLSPCEMFQKSSQTSLVSLKQCENCQLSMEVVKKVVNSIENLITYVGKANEEYTDKKISESEVSKLKKKVVHDIWKVTQWKVLTQMTEAVTMDTDALQDLLKHCFSERCSLSKALKVGEENVSRLISEKEKFKRDTDHFKSKCSELLRSKKKLEDMVSIKENEVKSLSELLDESGSTNDNLRKNNEDIADQLSKIQHELIVTKEELDMKSNEVCIFKKKFIMEMQNRKHAQEEAHVARTSVESLEEQLVSARRNVESLQADIEGERVQFLFQIQELQGNLERTRGEKNTLASELQHLQEEKTEALNEISKLKNKLKEKQEEGMLMSKYPHICGQADSELIGIPEVDMKNQIKANDIRIKFLHDENMALEKTIQKLKKKAQET